MSTRLTGRGGPCYPLAAPGEPVTASKRERQDAILELVSTRAVGSQEELRQLLIERGWGVTQSTLSRDMRDLRIARVPTPTGVRYTAGEHSAGEEGRAVLSGLLPQLFQKLEFTRELIVVRTFTAGAQPIAEAIDAEENPDILGTIAGENTVLLICRTELARERVVKRLLLLAAR
jgi:transcriptional regulator of arginine metabolism